MAPKDQSAAEFSRHAARARLRAARKGKKEETVRLQLQATLHKALAEHLLKGPSRTWRKE
jgi:hypothetical protein